MRRLVVTSTITAIVSVAVLLGISEINLLAPPASAFFVISKGGAVAGTQESSTHGPIAGAQFGHTQAASGSVLCGGKPATLTPSNGLTCAP